MDKYFVFSKVRGCYHASTLLQKSNGDILVASFAGSFEGMNDVEIVLAVFSKAEGRGREIQSFKVSDVPHWNPVLFRLTPERIALYFKVGANPATWLTYVTESVDEGDSWSLPRPLMSCGGKGGRGPVRNKPFRMSNGNVLAGGSTEDGYWRSFVDISSDNGKEWTKRMIPCQDIEVEDIPANNKLGMIQPTLWESAPDHVHALTRSNNHRIYRSDSSDGGQNWCEAYPTGVFNNNSGIDILKLGSYLLLAYNPVESNWGLRNNLQIGISDDNAHTFSQLEIVENSDAPMEFSYPAIIALDDRNYCMSYTFNRNNVALAFGSI